METILIKCPHCKEQMQAPKERESVICMFCGETILLDENRIKTEDTYDMGKCYEHLNNVLCGVEQACEGYRAKVREFKRDTYYSLFENYKAENYGFFISIKNCLANASDDILEGVYHQIANAFIKNTETELDCVKKKNDKFSVQMDRNMFMVTFVLPAIKEIGNKKADALADAICSEWHSSFKDSNIQASSYQSISDGFKRKLCYVTTAVCQNLNMGDDCEELRLIKDFRDHYLALTEDGRSLIDEYYDIAPTIVKRISREDDPETKYIWLYQNYIKPCVEFIKCGAQENCKTTYCEMVEALREEYMRDEHK